MLSRRLRSGGDSTPFVGALWDFANVLDNGTVQSFVPQTAPGRGLAFDLNGTNVYMRRDSNNLMYRFPLSTAWDITTRGTAVAPGVGFNAMPGDAMWWNSSGTIFYSQDGLNIRTAIPDAPFSASITTSTVHTVAPAVPGTGTRVWATMSADGTKLVYANDNNLNIYTLSTEWDLSTATLTSSRVGGITTGVSGLVRYDGKKILVQKQKGLGETFPTFYQYNLTTAWDITTSAADSIKVLTVDTIASDPAGMALHRGGTDFYWLNPYPSGFNSVVRHSFNT